MPAKKPKRRRHRDSEPTLQSLLSYMADSICADLCAAGHEQGRKPRSLKLLRNLAKELALPPWCHETASGEFEVSGDNFGMPDKMLRLKLGVRLDPHPLTPPEDVIDQEPKTAQPN